MASHLQTHSWRLSVLGFGVGPVQSSSNFVCISNDGLNGVALGELQVRSEFAAESRHAFDHLFGRGRPSHRPTMRAMPKPVVRVPMSDERC